MVVVGLTGKNCAGKDVVAALLEAHGYERHSLSDALRLEADKRGLERTRKNLRELGNELRGAHGPRVLGDMVKALVKSDKAVIVSIRNPSEVEALRELPGFVLFGVDAPPKVRFQRAVKRGREDPPDSLAEFLEREALENKADPTNQQLDATLALADETIINEGTLQALEKQVLALVKEYE